MLKNKCKEIWIKGKNLKNLELASKLGIKIFDLKNKNVNYFDRVFETVGRKQDLTLKESIDFVSSKGKIIILGVFEKDYINKIVLRDLFFKEANIIGSNCYEEMKELKQALKFIENNKKDLQKIITHKIKLEDFKKALKIVKNKKNQAVIKILITP